MTNNKTNTKITKTKQNKDIITLYSISKWIKILINFHCSTTPIKQTAYSKFLLLSHLLLRVVGLFQMRVIQRDTKIIVSRRFEHPPYRQIDNPLNDHSSFYPFSNAPSHLLHL